MNRRMFLGRSTAAAVGGLVLSSTGNGYASSNTNGRVDTAEKRYYYLKSMLKYLCSDLGPRPAGSPSYEKGIQFIKRELEDALPMAELDEYRFENWEITGRHELRIGDTILDTYPFHGCNGTPKEGLTGKLKKNEKGFPYLIVDERSGKTVAYLSVNQYGPAIPHSALRRKEKSSPIFGVAKYDIPKIEEAARRGEKVFIHLDVKSTPDTPSWNAVGTLPGQSEKEILFLAHADTVYPSPGANDNTASVITMLMLAHAFSGTQQDYTLTFVATGNEEFGTLGARHYAARREFEGTMKNIRFIVQFDSLTYGPDLLLNSNDAGLRNLVQSINDDLKINGTPRHNDSDAYVMDAGPFKPSGARAIYINSRGYDGITLPVYHRPEDIPETVGFDCVDNSFRIFSEFIRRVQRLG